MSLNVDSDEDRYARQALIPWWDQRRVAAATVLVVGCGALGNEIVKNLTLVGVGRIVVVDFDLVERSNLSRCALFRDTDAGYPKAVVIAEAAAALNREVEVIPIVGDIRASVGLGLVAEADVVLAGLDNREARLHVNQACWKTSTPWVDGAIEGLLGVMRVFVPPASACYECTMTARDHRLLAHRMSCSFVRTEDRWRGPAPTTATSASVIAAMQVQEAVKLLHAGGELPSFAGKGFVYNGVTHDSYPVAYARRPDCLSHDTYALTDATAARADEPLAQMMDDARRRLGPDTVLEFEVEIAISLRCTACSRVRSVMKPLVTLGPSAEQCSECGGSQYADILHHLDFSSPLLKLSARDFGLPPNDVITGRSATGRHHYLLNGDTSAIAPYQRLAARQSALEPTVLQAIFDHARSYPDVEIAGVLVGRVEEHRAVPTEILRVREAGEPCSVTFSHAAWQEIFAALDGGDGLEIMGWYHSHPGHGVFLSEHDLFIQRNFFNAAHHLAVVVDPQVGSHGTFGWCDGTIFLLRGGNVDERNLPR